jgi:hypothetical protein
MLFTKSINTKKADPNVEMRSTISDTINLALKNGVWPAVIIDHMENCLNGLRQKELARQYSSSAAYDQETLKPKANTAARAEEKRRADALGAEQQAYAAVVNERGRRDAIMNHGKTS